MLEDHAGVLTNVLNTHLLVDNILSLEDDGAPSGLLQKVDAAQQGGFATAGGADDGHDLALMDGEGNVL